MVGPLHIKEAFRMTLLFMELSMKTHLKEFWIRRNWLDNHAWMVVGAFSTNVDIRYSTQKMTPLTISLLQPISNLSGIGISTIPDHQGPHQSPKTATHTPKKQLFPYHIGFCGWYLVFHPKKHLKQHHFPYHLFFLRLRLRLRLRLNIS